MRLKESQEEETRARVREGVWESESVDNSNSVSFPEILTAYQENVSPIVGSVVTDSLRRLFDRHGASWLMEAIREAVRHNHPSIAYIEQPLENWKQYGYKIRREQPKTAWANKKTDKEDGASFFSDMSDIMDELRRRQDKGVM